MANVIFDRSANATSEPIEDGKITFSTNGDGKMYLDNGLERLEMGGAVEVDKTPSKTSPNPIQNQAVTNNFPQNTDVVNSLSSVMAVNEPNIPCGTLAVKELNNNLGGIKFGKTPEGEYGYIKAGADSVIPFSNVEEVIGFKITGSVQKIIELSFAPRFVCVFVQAKGGYSLGTFANVYFNGAIGGAHNQSVIAINKVEQNKVTVSCDSSNIGYWTYNLIAIR